jgi:hypothetical protein
LLLLLLLSTPLQALLAFAFGLGGTEATIYEAADLAEPAG